MKRLGSVIAIFAFAVNGAAWAADEQREPRTDALRDGWYGAPLFSFMLSDKDRLSNNGFGFAPTIGHRAGATSLELSFLYTKLGLGNLVPEATLIGGELTLLAGPFALPSVLSNFYGIVGFGAQRRQHHNRFPHDDTTMIGDAGVGSVWPIDVAGFDVALRAEARYRFDVQHLPVPDGVPRTFRDWIFDFGVQIPLSRKPPPPPPPQKPVVVPVQP